MCIEFQNDPVHMSQPTLDLFWNAVSEFHGEGETNIVICLKEQQSCLASDKAAEFENKSEGRRWLWETWEDEHIFSGNGWSEDFWVQRYKKTWKDTWRNSTNPMPPSLHAIAFHLPILNCDILLRLQCCCGKWRDMMKSDLCCCWQLPRVVICSDFAKCYHCWSEFTELHSHWSTACRLLLSDVLTFIVFTQSLAPRWHTTIWLLSCGWMLRIH